MPETISKDVKFGMAYMTKSTTRIVEFDLPEWSGRMTVADALAAVKALRDFCNEAEAALNKCSERGGEPS